MTNTKKVTQVMKYEIQFEKELYDILREIQHSVWRIKNKATSIAYDWQQFSFSYNERFGEYPNNKKILGKSVVSDIYSQVKELGSFITSYIADASTQEAVKKFEELKLDIVKGNKNIPSYKRDGSFPIRTKQIKDLSKINNKTYTFKLALLSKEGSKQQNKPTQIPVKLKTGGSAKEILDRVVSGEYKLCDSRISLKKNKYYLLMVYQHEVKQMDLDENNITGIDMGIVYPVYMAFNNNSNRYNVEGGEIDQFRKGIQARRNALLKQGKYCGEGRRGHGRVTRLIPIQKLEGRVEDFKKTTNHKYSKYVVDMAIKHNCGTIQMEDLSGIADGEKKSTFLGNWTYYDLQQKITYKAEKIGIKVVKIKPDYTSQRCSKCGNIHKENRDAKKDQSKFKCVTCGFETNADYNAARNIATKDIEKIIHDQLKAQERALKHAMKYEA